MNKRVISNNVIFADVTKLISEGKELRLKAKGRSMLPFIICESDTLQLVPVAKVVIGDIILAHLTAEDRYVIHRVVGLAECEVQLMGDGNLLQIERCSYDEVVAKVSTIYRGRWSFDCDGRLFRFASWLWRKALPLRPKLLRVFSILRRLLGATTRQQSAQ